MGGNDGIGIGASRAGVVDTGGIGGMGGIGAGGAGGEEGGGGTGAGKAGGAGGGGAGDPGVATPSNLMSSIAMSPSHDGPRTPTISTALRPLTSTTVSCHAGPCAPS
mmetsp:Transcript_1047/g.3744  ORF Transcript_1047/g.3744 Transcript_1047/m.3744 type:complete len:107 (+) Transcript_1047:694-1014(+)